MAGITLKINGLGDLRKRITKAPSVIKKEVRAELQVSANNIRNNAIRDAPADQGIIRSGIQVEDLAETKFGIFSNASYSGFLEFGTKGKTQIPPGYEKVAAELKGIKGGTWEEFVDNMTGWVKRKGLAGKFSVKSRRRLGSKLSQAIEDRQLAIFLAKYIIRHGIKPHPFFFKHFEPEKVRLLKNIKNILTAV